MEEKLKTINWYTAQRNLINIPINWIHFDQAGVEEFNKIYLQIKETTPYMYEKTRSGGICIKGTKFRMPCWNVDVTKTSVTLTYLGRECYRIRLRCNFRENEQDKWSLSGRAGYKQFNEIVKAHGGNLEELGIKDGNMVKELIPPAIIDVKEEFIDQTLEDVWHLDINSAYMAGIKKYCAYHQWDNPKTMKAIQQAIDEIYNHRKDGTEESKHYKAILNVTQGFMQSEYCVINGYKYALAHLSRAGIEYCIETIKSIDRRMIREGAVIIAHNTDGVFLKKPPTWTDERMREASQTCLGGVKVDVHCKRIRFKSKGAYEYIDEDNKYHPVIRGATKLDVLLPRSKWKWGDIYQENAMPLKYKWTTDKGVILLNEQNNG